jgi:tripartite ATP-independent transporter DctP family solute receptor
MRKTWMLVFVCALIIVMLSGVTFGAANSYKIRAGIGLNDQSADYKCLVSFKKIVEQQTNKAITVDVYPSSQLGDDVGMMEALQLGVQEMTWPTSSPVATFVNEFKVFDLPFLFPSSGAVDYVVDGPVGKSLLNKLTVKGIIGLGYGEMGYRNLTNNIRSVKKPEDLKGIKIRTMENPVHIAVMKALGAKPTAMPFGELYSALQQGVVDAQETPWSVTCDSKFYEVQKYASDIKYVYGPSVLMISKKFWDKLPNNMQSIVKEAAAKICKLNRSMKRKQEAEYVKLLKSELEYTEMSSEQLAQFQKAAQPVYKQFSDINDLIKKVQNEIKKYQNKQSKSK